MPHDSHHNKGDGFITSLRHCGDGLREMLKDQRSKFNQRIEDQSLTLPRVTIYTARSLNMSRSDLI